MYVQKDKNIKLTEAEKLLEIKRAVKYKAERGGLGQTLEDLLKQTPYLQRQDRIKT